MEKEEGRPCLVCGKLHNNIPPTCSRECSLIELGVKEDPFIAVLKPSYRSKSGEIKQARRVENAKGEFICYVVNKKDM